MSGYTPIATEVIRSLVWTNISWTNISTSITNRSTTSISVVPNRDGTKPCMWFEEGLGDFQYIDHGAENTLSTVECHIFYRPTKNDATTIGNYKRDKNHITEEVTRVIRGNRTNASGYEFIYVNGIVSMDTENDATSDVPYLETIVKIKLRKTREEFT